jgi:hypothetical protein
VHARRARLHGLFGFLTVVWAAVLVRGHGAGIWVLLLFGAVLAGTGALWLHLSRHPPRLEVSRDAIRLLHGTQPRAQELLRESDELDVRLGGGKYPQPYLVVVASDQPGIAINMFDRAELARACEAQGWQFRGLKRELLPL